MLGGGPIAIGPPPSFEKHSETLLKSGAGTGSFEDAWHPLSFGKPFDAAQDKLRTAPDPLPLRLCSGQASRERGRRSFLSPWWERIEERGESYELPPPYTSFEIVILSFAS